MGCKIKSFGAQSKDNCAEMHHGTNPTILLGKIPEWEAQRISTERSIFKSRRLNYDSEEVLNGFHAILPKFPKLGELPKVSPGNLLIKKLNLLEVNAIKRKHHLSKILTMIQKVRVRSGIFIGSWCLSTSVLR